MKKKTEASTNATNETPYTNPVVVPSLAKLSYEASVLYGESYNGWVPVGIKLISTNSTAYPISKSINLCYRQYLPMGGSSDGIIRAANVTVPANSFIINEFWYDMHAGHGISYDLWVTDTDGTISNKTR
jgi:hypothetical protein